MRDKRRAHILFFLSMIVLVVCISIPVGIALLVSESNVCSEGQGIELRTRGGDYVCVNKNVVIE